MRTTNFLLPLLLAAVAALAPLRAFAQSKPELNSAPPAAPHPAPAPPATVPTEPTPAAPSPAPVRTSPDAPSGLNLPNRNGTGSATEETPYKKFFLYTNFGLGFSSSQNLNHFNGSLAPALGYRLSEKFAVGPGVSYSYTSYSLTSNAGGALNVNGDRSIHLSSIGVKGFAQYIVYHEFFVHAEYEVTRAELLKEDAAGYSTYKRTASTPLAGIGYRSALGENAAFDIVGLYNFDSSVFSLYPPLVVRFSFLFDLGR